MNGQKKMKFLKHKLWRLRRSIKFFFQRLFRGFDDSIAWNFDYEFGKWAYPRFKRFREMHHGYPHNTTSEEWESILEDIEHAFSLIANEGYFDLGEEEADQVSKGLKLFVKWFDYLWD